MDNLNELFEINLERHGTQEAGDLPEFLQTSAKKDDLDVYYFNETDAAASRSLDFKEYKENGDISRDAQNYNVNSYDRDDLLRAYMTPTLSAKETDFNESEKN